MVWWYTEGWRQCLHRIWERLEATLDYFSFGLLLSTLFAPFRQISAGSVRGSLDVQMRAFLDRLISRVIGSIIRLITIGIGSIMLLVNVVVGVIIVVLWALVPILPIIGLLLYASGWMPWSN